MPSKNKKLNAAIRKLTKDVKKTKIAKEINNSLKNLDNKIAKKIASASGSGAYAMGRGAYAMGRGVYGMRSNTAYEPGLTESDFSRPLFPRQGVNGNITIIGHNHGAGATMDSMTFDDGRIKIRRREYVSDINSTGSLAFDNQTFSINPGLPGVFPWLSQMAANYTSYKAVRVLFYYIPVISDMSVSSVGSLGTVILAANGNAASPKFTTKSQMVQYQGAVSGRISDKIICGVECDPAKRVGDGLYIRSGNLNDNEDIKTYDLATFQLALAGVPDAYTVGTQLGELWVEYEFELVAPRLYSQMGLSIETDRFWSDGTGATTVLPLGTSPLTSTANSLGGYVTNATATKYYFPDNFSGSVMMLLKMQGTSIVAPAVTYGGQITVLNLDSVNTNLDTNKNTSQGTAAIEVVYAYYTVSPALAPDGNFLTLSATTATGTQDVTFIVQVINNSAGAVHGSNTTYAFM